MAFLLAKLATAFTVKGFGALVTALDAAKTAATAAASATKKIGADYVVPAALAATRGAMAGLPALASGIGYGIGGIVNATGAVTKGVAAAGSALAMPALRGGLAGVQKAASLAGGAIGKMGGGAMRMLDNEIQGGEKSLNALRQAADSAFTQLSQMAGIDFGRIMRLGTIGGLSSAVVDLTGSFIKAEDKAKILQARFESMGMEGEKETKNFKEFVRQLAETGAVTRDMASSMAMVALQRGPNPANYQQTATAAAALSARLGISGEMAVRMINQGEQDWKRYNALIRRANIEISEHASKAEVMAKVNKLIAEGREIGGKMGDTFQARVERMKNQFTDLRMEISKSIGPPMMEMVLQVMSVVRDVVGAIQEWVNHHRQLIRHVGESIATFVKWAGGIGLGISALMLLSRALQTTRLAGMALAAVKLALWAVTTTLWVTWKILTLAATVVMIAFSAAIVAWKVVVIAAAAGMAIWSGAMLVAKAVAWLFNAALMAMNILMAPVAIIAFVAGIAALSAVVIGLIGGVSALWEAFSGSASAASELKKSSGGFEAIVEIFKEWWGYLKLIWEVFRVDAPLAWKMLKAGFNLAIEQVKQLWPPLWAFIKQGAEATWKYITAAFKYGFFEAIMDAQLAMMKAAPDKFKSVVEPSRALSEVVGRAYLDMVEAKKKFGEVKFVMPGMDTEEIRNARKEMDDLAKEGAAAVAKAKDADKKKKEKEIVPMGGKGPNEDQAGGDKRRAGGFGDLTSIWKKMQEASSGDKMADLLSVAKKQQATNEEHKKIAEKMNGNLENMLKQMGDKAPGVIPM